MTRRIAAVATHIGEVVGVRGAEISVNLRHLPSSLLLVDGGSYRVGQLGSFVRIPVGYTNLYAVITQVGSRPTESNEDSSIRFGEDWLTVVLFGEVSDGEFERGVSQYPTIGDEVHIATASDISTIYANRLDRSVSVELGSVVGAPNVRARIDLSSLVSRHACIVGSTGSGKSNLVSVLLRSFASEPALRSSRVIVVDPHGEYSSALDGVPHTRVSSGLRATNPLLVPFWALPFDELARVAFGPSGETQLEYLREAVRAAKFASLGRNHIAIDDSAVSADSPIPFSLRRLWFDLRIVEDITFTDNAQTTPSTPSHQGDPEALIARQYPAPGLGSSSPFASRSRKGIGRQLDFLLSRLRDPRYAFMFSPGDYEPNLDGEIRRDIDELLASWIGMPEPLCVMDVSGLPPDVVETVVGSMLLLVYETLFWAMDTAVGGKQQPLLVAVDEAHRFVASGSDTLSARMCRRIAREGRKYGVGLLVVSQRPADLDATLLSQCGSMIALRTTNGADRATVASSVPDDLGGLTGLLPSLRTGECLVLGEVLQIPARIKVSKAPARPIGDDPDLFDAWSRERPGSELYEEAIAAWRNQTLAG